MLDPVCVFAVASSLTHLITEGLVSPLPTGEMPFSLAAVPVASLVHFSSLTLTAGSPNMFL